MIRRWLNRPRPVPPHSRHVGTAAADHVAITRHDKEQHMTQPLTPEAVSAILRDPDSPLYPSQITVFCDHCGVQATGDYMVSEGMTSTERLAVARKHLVDNAGWEHTDDGDDFCPEHAGTPAV